MYQAKIESKSQYRNRILRIMDEKNISLEQLSDMTKISLNKLKLTFDYKRDLKCDELESVCRALNCIPSDLLTPRTLQTPTPKIQTQMQPQKNHKKVEYVSIKSFIKVKEASKIFSIGDRTLYNAIRNKELKAYRPNGRDYLIKVIELESWIQSKPV